MHVLVLETNLLWTSRLRQSLSALGHQVTISGHLPDFGPSSTPQFDLAILNLADARLAEAVATLKAQEIPILAHAGHKEKDLHALGAAVGVELLATNSELTHKLPQLLERLHS